MSMFILCERRQRPNLGVFISKIENCVNNKRTNKAQQAEALWCRAEDLSLIFRTHEVAGENRPKLSSEFTCTQCPSKTRNKLK